MPSIASEWITERSEHNGLAAWMANHWRIYSAEKYTSSILNPRAYILTAHPSMQQTSSCPNRIVLITNYARAIFNRRFLARSLRLIFLPSADVTSVSAMQGVWVYNMHAVGILLRFNGIVK